VEETQYKIQKEPNQQDNDKTINETEINNENREKKDQETLMKIETSHTSQDLKIKTKRKRSSKEKNNDKRNQNIKIKIILKL
jgi:hypothetical protein